MISTHYARPYYDVQQWLIEHMIPHVHAPVQKSYNTIIIVYNGPPLAYDRWRNGPPLGQQ